MVTLAKGDIFKMADHTDLTVVFGRIGFNIMSHFWQQFSEERPEFSGIRDPFKSKRLAGRPFLWSNNRWIWFIPIVENKGISDQQLRETMDEIFNWANDNGVVTIASNGVSDIDHGINPTENRNSDKRRVKMIKGAASEAQKKYGFEITLTSMNAVFVES